MPCWRSTAPGSPRPPPPSRRWCALGDEPLDRATGKLGRGFPRRLRRPRPDKGENMNILDGFRLDERVAIVPGGGGAIGSELARALAAAGALVAVVGRAAEALERAAAQVPRAGSEGRGAGGGMGTPG